MSGIENPTDDLPSTETEACDLGGCREPWAAEVERRNGPRRLRLCEVHHDAWTHGERELYAEIEEVAGRAPAMSSLFGLARTIDGRRGNGRKRSA